MKTTTLKNKTLTNKIGLGLSIAILTIVVLGMIAVYGNTHRAEIFYSLEPRLLGYYHFAINMFAALVAIINIIEFALVQKRKVAILPSWLHICNLTVCVGLMFNFLFTLCYLVPLVAHTEYNIEYLYAGSNMIFNIGTPILGAILYIFCFKNYSLKNKWLSLVGLIPVFIYFTIYLVLVLTNSNGTVINENWDVYRFGNKYWYLLIVAYIAIIIIAGAMCLGIWKLNKISKLNRWMFVAIINIAIVAMMIPTTIWMFYYNVEFDSANEGLTKVQSAFMRFIYFTHISNWWLGVSSVIYSVYAIKLYKGQIKKIPMWAQIVRLAGISAVSVTLIMQFVVSCAYMINYTEWASWQEALTYAYKKCFQKYLMFEHFIIPVVAIASFIILEYSELRWSHILHAASPLAIYVLIYTIVVYCHIGQPLRKETHEGWVTPWDIYDVTAISPQTGKYFYWTTPFITYAIMLILNWIFWICNRKVHLGLPKKSPAWAQLKQDYNNWKKAK